LRPKNERENQKGEEEEKGFDESVRWFLIAVSGTMKVSAAEPTSVVSKKENSGNFWKK
jgi:hypothetical protein